MVLRKYNVLTANRYLYGAIAKPVTLLKRNDDQQQGTVRAVQLWDCRRGRIVKTGQTLQGDMSSDHRADWHIPAVQLINAGVNWLNALDRFVEKYDDGMIPLNPWRFWQAESDTNIDVRLFETWIVVSCLRVDPNPPVP